MEKGQKEQRIAQLVQELLELIGDNPQRTGLQDTPKRVARMYAEIYRGYNPAQKPNITTFPNGEDGIVYDSMVVDTGDFYSCCEHHMMPFFGKYYFAYLPHPKGKILGISKIGRVVDYCAAKLQVQERLTHEVVEMLGDALGGEYPPLGIALVMRGEHLCKTMRGARKKGEMVSSCLTGLFQTDSALRAEFMNLINQMK
ncbi:GTP cyclohydrolase I [uncultured Duncaniella sp.]|uniref:GTP cyclohydrolase I n=1 Tax=uncultured Duncaniella sp. TaxID=2768039 RepID=UPI002658A150|nr:GTP cyclohydrolase I [uncultured Duncaniella sp.]